MNQLKSLLYFFVCIPLCCFSQVPVDPMSALLKRLNTEANVLPEKLLASKSVVIYQGNFTEKEFSTIQTQFQRTGVDAVAYYDAELFFAGKDVELGLFTYLNQRDIVSLILLAKKATGYKLAVSLFNKKENWIDQDQPAWAENSNSLAELLRSLYRQSWSQQVKQNFLINDYAERDLPFSIFRGRRSEFFAVDLKVDKLAVPAFQSKEDSIVLAGLLTAYPFNYGLTDKTWTTQKLRQEGYLYELCYIYARGKTARSLLGYEVKEGESGFISLSFLEGKSQMKTFAADIPVYKFYVRHVVSGNIFLGKAWDADPDWKKALENHIQAFRTELQIR
jgi:hypothetical protein